MEEDFEVITKEGVWKKQRFILHCVDGIVKSMSVDGRPQTIVGVGKPDPDMMKRGGIPIGMLFHAKNKKIFYVDGTDWKKSIKMTLSTPPIVDIKAKN